MSDRAPALPDNIKERILRAPPLRQRIVRLGLWLGCGTAAVAFAQFWFFPWLRAWLAVADAAELALRLRIVFSGLSLSILAASAWVFHVGMRTLKVGQWPLPGTFVLRDTPVSTGRGVRARAWVMIAWSIAAAALGIFAFMMPALMRAG